MLTKILTIVILLATSLFSLNAAAEGRFSPEAIKESFTHKNPHIKYRPGVLVMGKSRDSVIRAFGPPNGSDFKNGRIQDVYIFMEDGSLYVNPSLHARNVALAVVTMGTSIAVRQARLAAQRTKLTIYNVYYNRFNNIINVDVTPAKAFKNPAKPH
jgi:hypothetical protein